jgi:hypothetical protein
MGTIGDPLGIGIVTSLAHPGGNITGLRIPTIVTTRSDGSRPLVPIDRDHCGAGYEGAVRCIC